MADSSDNTDERGFASMNPGKQKDTAREGGKATGGKNLTTEARAKGGRNSHGGGRRNNK